MNVKLTRSQKIKVLNSLDIFHIMQQILLRESKIDRDKEHFWLVCLAQNNTILFIELISLGSVNATVVEPMDVFSFALQKRAVQLIMVHNHPSGELKPSKSDIELTDRMMAIGKFIRVPVIDHLIISEKDYYSFDDSGMLASIERKSHYDLTFSEIDFLKEEMKDAEKKKAVEIAKRALEQEIPLNIVVKISGLSKKLVETLKKEVDEKVK